MKRQVTTEQLARMIQKGFEEVDKKLDETAKRKEVNERFDKIEKLILRDYGKRIEKLESQVKELRELLAV